MIFESINSNKLKDRGIEKKRSDVDRRNFFKKIKDISIMAGGVAFGVFPESANSKDIIYDLLENPRVISDEKIEMILVEKTQGWDDKKRELLKKELEMLQNPDFIEELKLRKQSNWIAYKNDGVGTYYGDDEDLGGIIPPIPNVDLKKGVENQDSNSKSSLGYIHNNVTKEDICLIDGYPEDPKKCRDIIKK